MQYIFLSHDVDWRKQGPPLEHILSRKDRFEPELFEKTKPKICIVIFLNIWK